MKPWLGDACSLAEAIRRGDVRSADAVEASLEAIAASRLNAVVYLDAEGARRQAEAVDRRAAAGEDPGRFGGVPLLVKDLEHAQGMPTTFGSVPYKDNVVDHDSTHVARLRAAGAVILGKSAAPEFGLVAYTATKLHGVTRNPWNLERTPAGSSGGSAAAVSGGLAPLATASDGGGSIRKPAAFCGLVGLKGTFGRIPRGPHAENGPLTSCWGTVSRSVRDTARWFDVASGYDARDPFSLPRIEGWERDLGTRDLRGLRVAVSPDLGCAAIAADVRKVVTAAADALVEATGMRRVEIDVRLPEGGAKWLNAGAPSLFNDLKDYWPDCKDDLTFEIAFSMQWTAENYRIWHAASVDRFRVVLNEAMADLFEQTDIVLCATDPVEPFAAEGPMPSRVDGERVGRNNNGALTIPANITGYPAISIPAGLTPSGLPVGLQAYARRHEEQTLLDIALTMERARPWPLVAPGAPV
jgi:aspartyl-tRNA(Asn)/glutamyl-tRNA(Gln) amidotransferase subunit A